jgi:hypothetical protein
MSRLLVAFSGDGGGHAGVEFVLDQDMAAVFGGEAGDEGFSVLGDVAREVGGYADIEGAVAGAGHDVGGGLRSGGTWCGIGRRIVGACQQPLNEYGCLGCFTPFWVRNDGGAFGVRQKGVLGAP